MSQLKAVLLIAALTGPVWAGDDVVKWPDCYCTDKGGARVELGETRCMFVDGRSFTAQCQMSLNNPMWREVGEGCLSSELQQPVSPSSSS